MKSLKTHFYCTILKLMGDHSFIIPEFYLQCGILEIVETSGSCIINCGQVFIFEINKLFKKTSDYKYQFDVLRLEFVFVYIGLINIAIK